jgi:hypothetical protein
LEEKPEKRFIRRERAGVGNDEHAESLWSCVLGLGGRRDLIARAAAGGLVGALLAAFAFEMAGALLFPERRPAPCR